MARFAAWWRRLGRPGKIAIITLAVVVGLVILVAVIPTSENDGEEASPPPPSATQAPPPPPPAATPQSRVRDAIGDSVDAGGYAGELEVRGVAFGRREVEVIVTTPEGGFEGASCGDLDDGAKAVFQKIYDDAGWNGSAVLIYQGGLVSTQTGEELPDANIGIFTMPAKLANQIDWSNDDAIDFNIDWSNYRDFCHPALE